MNALKPCPFCGGEARKVTETIDPDDLDFMTFDDIDYPDCFEITCENERCISGWYLSPKDWNTRPIEDDLRARIAELEARAEKAEAMVEKLIEAGRMMKQPETIEEFHRGRRDYNALVAEWKERE